MFESTKEVVNLTPHEINIWIKGDQSPNKIIDIPPSGNVARLHIKVTDVGKVLNIPVVHSVGRRVIGLPEPHDGVIYLVSSTVAREVKRSDVLCPDTTDDGVIRDGAGNIVAVTRFQLFWDGE
jgi:hypothetical protein